MKRCAPVAVLCLALVLPVSSAAAFSSGSYRGTNTQGFPVAFKVVDKRVRVGRRTVVKRYVRLLGAFTTTKMTCPDGFTVDFSTTASPAILALVSSAGSFALTIPRGGFPLKFSGRLTGTGRNSTASGKLSNVLRGETHGRTCTSGRLTWTARRT